MCSASAPEFRVANEFAAVAVSLDTSGNGCRARIENLRNGRHVLLDPLELASLTFAQHRDLRGLVDPSALGWTDAGDDAAVDEEVW